MVPAIVEPDSRDYDPPVMALRFGNFRDVILNRQLLSSLGL